MGTQLEHPVAVRRMRVRGLQKTHESVVRQELASLNKARTLGELHQGCLAVAGALQSLGIFDSADLLMDTAQGATPHGAALVDIVCTVTEKKRLTSASTMVATQSSENTMEAKVAVRNQLGRAEIFEAQMEMGQQKSSSFKLSAVRPRWMGQDAQLSADVSKQAISHIKHSSFVQKLLGASASVRVGSAGAAGGRHELTYALELRDVCRLTPHTASWAILQQRGQSLKSSLSHSYARSTVDHRLVPTSGALLRLHTELAGLAPFPLGDARFVKSTFTAAAFQPLMANGRLTASVQVHAGVLLPLGGLFGGLLGGPTESHICDRFFCGGPGSLWGFRTRGVGPRDERHSLASPLPPPASAAEPPAAAPKKPPSISSHDALGGDLLGVATASLSTTLPGNLAKSDGHAHIFASVGGLQGLAAVRAAGSVVPSLRASVGAGVALPTPLGRLELNVVHVLRKAPSDASVGNGLQLGVTAGFS